MKNLARFTIACFAAQLLFVGIINASVTGNHAAKQSTVFAMPDSDIGSNDEPTEAF